MFEKDLQRRLLRIFGVKKTTFLAPDMGALEQDCLFIEISDCKSRMSAGDGGRQIAKATGTLSVFSQNERTPFGFFNKRLEQADPADTRLFFFEKEQDILDSPARIQNLNERRITFTFFYDAQYDPDRGSMTSLQTSIEIQE